MTEMPNACSKCGGPLPLQFGRGRRRTKCETCAPSRNRKPAGAAIQRAVPSAGILASTEAELRASGVLDSAFGQAAVMIAQRLEAGTDNGSGVAALVRQWQSMMAAALAKEEAEADPLDELAEKRRQRRSG